MAIHCKSCQGICSGKETVESYNNRVLEAINSIKLQADNLVIKETGRNENEIGFALILNGIYQGYGYIDKELELPIEEMYIPYLIPQKDNRDIQRILRSYLKKKEASEEAS